jgi:hypothetical protein
MNIAVANLFNHLPAHSKVWIYQSNQPIDAAVAENIRADVKQFVSGWTAHSEKVIADADVLFNYFIVLVADENAVKVSGCSIDSSVRFIQLLEEKYQLNLFDRFYTVYVNNNEVKGADKVSLQHLIDEGTLTADTLVFNNLIQHVAQLQNEWLLPLKQSWHSRVFRFAVDANNGTH